MCLLTCLHEAALLHSLNKKFFLVFACKQAPQLHWGVSGKTVRWRMSQWVKWATRGMGRGLWEGEPARTFIILSPAPFMLGLSIKTIKQNEPIRFVQFFALFIQPKLSKQFYTCSIFLCFDSFSISQLCHFFGPNAIREPVCWLFWYLFLFFYINKHKYL